MSTSLIDSQPAAGTHDDQIVPLNKNKLISFAELEFKSGVKALAAGDRPETYFAALLNGEVCFIQGKTLWRESVLGRHGHYATCVSLDAAGSFAACGTINGGLVVWDMRSKERLFQRIAHAAPVREVALDSKSQLLFSVGQDSILYVHDLRSAKIILGTFVPYAPVAMRLEQNQIHILTVNAEILSYNFLNTSPLDKEN